MTFCRMSKAKRKQWSAESMVAAIQAVEEGKGLREAARLYNLPVETLRRRITGTVSVDCRPGPSTILTSYEEDRLVRYCVEVSDMGFGLSREEVMQKAFLIADKSGADRFLQLGTNFYLKILVPDQNFQADRIFRDIYLLPRAEYLRKGLSDWFCPSVCHAKKFRNWTL